MGMRRLRAVERIKSDLDVSADQSRPNANCYWVRPGKLLAGEYPAADDEDTARERLLAYLDHGVNAFVDLTQPGELVLYLPWLEEEAEQRGIEVGYHRMSIPDMQVPASRQHMRATLNLIDDSLRDGRVVYVHCWGGVGRTGTVIGCYLARHGLGGDQALHTLSRLWQQVEKSWRFERTPQTDAQREWVKVWEG